MKGEKEIHLLVLSPSPNGDGLSGNLRVASLNQKPSYVALSYAWEEPIRRSESVWTFLGLYQFLRQCYWRYLQPGFVTIQLNGMNHKIHRNFASALFHLRRDDEPLCIWADAPCINQENSFEKKSQVGMMDLIYANAQKTYVWLGPKADNSDAAMDFVFSSSRLNMKDLEKVRGAAALAPFQALRALFASSWLSWIWTIQEILLSRQAVVKCGDREVDFQRFVDLATTERAIVMAPPPGVDTSVQWIWIPRMPSFDIMTEWRKLPRSKNPLSFWMEHTTSFSFTLSRDRIYALLKISKAHDRDAIMVDYSEKTSNAQIFKNLAVYFLQNENDLKFLRCG